MLGAAMTDAMVLKLKAAEALRYALWETTVFKPKEQIISEVQARFRDLKSPRDVDAKTTDLLLLPLPDGLSWQVSLDTTSTKAGIGGERAPLPDGGFSSAVGMVAGGLSTSVDAAAKEQGFNLFGEAVATVSLTRAREAATVLLAGGDFVGLRDGASLSLPKGLAELSIHAPLATERPMKLVFDTWKAWPKPAQLTLSEAPTDTSVSPLQTYPAVERAVAAQVKQIAFAGLARFPWFERLDGVANQIAQSGISEALLGGHLPDVFSSERMDGPFAGPISILPVGLPAESWAPSLCDAAGVSRTCGTQRLGDLVTSADTPQYLTDDDAMGSHVDATRYTVPFRINSRYWTKSGGVNEPSADSPSLQALPEDLATGNESVKAWTCRGHFFAGAQSAQLTDRAARYGSGCP
jgi:hypothetical protein